MQTTVINFTTEEKTKKEAQKVAKKMGLSLSTVLNNYLKHFIHTQTVVFSTMNEAPTKYLTDMLKKSEKDIREGQSISFDKPQDALSYVDSLIENDKGSR